jgi:hypothetical protein
VPDGPFAIKVQYSVNVDGVAPVSETVSDTAQALVKLQVDVPPPGDKEEDHIVRVAIMPDAVDQPTFLLVKPLSASADFDSTKPDAKQGDKERVTEQLTTALEPGVLWYSTANSDLDYPKQWKPLPGGHLFVNGMAQWVTAPVGAKTEPGPLTALWFRSAEKHYVYQNKGTDKEKKAPATISVLIVAGYSADLPVPPPTTPAKTPAPPPAGIR